MSISYGSGIQIASNHCVTKLKPDNS